MCCPPAHHDLRQCGMNVRDASAALGIPEREVLRRLHSGELRGVPYRGRTGWRLDHYYVGQLAERRRLHELFLWFLAWPGWSW